MKTTSTKICMNVRVHVYDIIESNLLSAPFYFLDRISLILVLEKIEFYVIFRVSSTDPLLFVSNF